jgi:hypothetical protein
MVGFDFGEGRGGMRDAAAAREMVELNGLGGVLCRLVGGDLS